MTHQDPNAVYFGRESVNDFYVDHPDVAPVHCCIRWDPGEEAYHLVDLGSESGTRIDGERVPTHGRVVLLRPDTPPERPPVVGLGSDVEFVLAPRHLEKLAGTTTAPTLLTGARDRSGDRAESERVPAGAEALGSVAPPVAEPRARGDWPTRGGAALTLGSDPSRDVRILGRTVSPRHAALHVERAGRFVLEDYGSQAGSHVAGRPVVRAELQVGDEFTLGAYALVLDADLVDRLESRRRMARRGELPGLDPGLPDAVTVGSHPANTIVLPEGTAAEWHVTLHPVEERHGYVVWPTGDAPVRVGPHDNQIPAGLFLDAHDVLFLGTYRLSLRSIPGRVARRSDAVDTIPFPSHSGVFTLGRADWVEPTPHGYGQGVPHVQVAVPTVSRFHAVVHCDGAFLRIENHGANGTFVDEHAVDALAPVARDAEIRLGSSYRFRFVASDAEVERRYGVDFVLEARRVAWDASAHNRILHPIDVAVYPTELVGVMGPSGAGKTTLLKVLAGLLDPVAPGEVRVNGRPTDAARGVLQRALGYLPQEDIVFPQLTVRESLRFTGRLRGLADADLELRIDEVLGALGISELSDNLIGDAIESGLSGGERKRVNLAQELLTDPGLLLLDEPTSGLSSEDANAVMGLLRGLANAGKTIVLTTHQPSIEAFRHLDNVLYVVRGRQVFYGPAHPDSLLFFNPDAQGPRRDEVLSDPGHALRPIHTEVAEVAESTGLPRAEAEVEVAERLAARYATSTQRRIYVEDRLERDTHGLLVDGEEDDAAPRRSIAQQLVFLVERACLVKWRDKQQTGILLAQAPIIALLLTVFGAESQAAPFFSGLAREPSALFLVVASAIWFGCSNAAREIVGEWPIYHRELRAGVRRASYLLSKYVVLGGLCLLQCAVMLAILHPVLDLHGSFTVMLGVLFLVSLVGVGMGLLVSAVVRRPPAAISFVPILLIPQIVLGGAILPLPDMPHLGDVGPWSLGRQVVPGFFASRWGFEAILDVEYGQPMDVTGEVCGFRGHLPCTRDDVEDILSLCNAFDVEDDGSKWTCFLHDDGTEARYVPVTRECLESDGETLVRTPECVLPGPDGDTPVPIVPPTEAPLCRSLCSAMNDEMAISPIDHAFGIELADARRAEARRRLPEREVTVVSTRAGRAACVHALIWMNLALFLAVAFGLRWREIREAS